ncbi:hypothetical protein E8E11_001992 [Didymella keratinophila]|nr:hypothetical protein E8E11_001992 [Didymella keratinophila]
MFRLQPTRSLARATRTQFIQPRFLSTSRPLFAQKGAEDKDSLKTTSNEYSKSGSDDAAAHTDAAFDPNQTSPEAAEASAQKEAGGADNSLNVSPGNHEVSHANDPEIGGASQGTNDKASGAGRPNKQGGGSSGGGKHN